MKKFNYLAFVFVAGLLFFASCGDDDDMGGDLDCDNIAAKYADDIAPIIAAKCATVGCHAAGAVNGDYTTYAGIEDRAKNGDMKREVITEMTMPQSGTLSQTELDKIECWLEAGAPDN